jgi:uncharacterized protein (DUF488 family)
VRLVVDVRLTPMSRKRGLSKHGLAQTLNEAGIDYLHLPQLGNPRDNRDAYPRGDPKALDRYRALLRSEAATLDELDVRSRAQAIALLCVERDPARCHRMLVAEALVARDPDLTVEQL